MIERFGKYHRGGAGLSVAIPLLEKVAYKRSLKESTLAIHPMTAITKDNVVSLDGAVCIKCRHVRGELRDRRARGRDPSSRSRACREVGNLELDELFLDAKLNAAICSALDQATEPGASARCATRSPTSL